MKKILYFFLFIIAVFLFFKNCGFEIGNVRIGKQDDFVGKNRTDFENSNFSKKINSSDSLYVLNTWATWCSPCIKEFPIFDKLIEENPQVSFLFLSIDKDSIKLSKFLIENNKTDDITFNNIEYRNSILNTLNNKKTDAWISNYIVPETYFIKKGKVLKKVSGSINYDQVNELIKIYK